MAKGKEKKSAPAAAKKAGTATAEKTASAKTGATEAAQNAATETKSCPHCGIHESKERSDEERKNLMNRLKRIEGQVRGLEKMIEDNAYCPDVLVQASAVSSAINSFNKALMAEHIRSCVVQDIKEGNEETIEELISVLQKLMK